MLIYVISSRLTVILEGQSGWKVEQKHISLQSRSWTKLETRDLVVWGLASNWCSNESTKTER